MTPEKTEQNLQELLAGYVLNDLTLAEREQVEVQLKTHPHLVEEIKALQATLNLLPFALPETASPPPLLLSQPSRLSWIKSISWWKLVLGGLIVTAIASLSIHNRQLQHQVATLQQTQSQTAQNPQQISQYRAVVKLLQQSDKHLLTLRSTQNPEMATGSIIASLNQASAMLVLRNVPLPPTDKVYRLWAVINGQKVVCRSFLPNPQGEVFLEIPAQKWFAASQVMITIESAQQVQQPTGELVIEGRYLKAES
jgi:anti-sigma-K factor RskA